MDIVVRVENLTAGCVTDEKRPRFSFSIESDKQGAELAEATIRVGDWAYKTHSQILIPYGGKPLKPFTEYTVSVEAKLKDGETGRAQTTFRTGRMDTPWKAQWISDASYHFTEKKVSPIPMTFRKRIYTNKKIARATLFATAMGIYDAYINNTRVSDRYFAPGFTSYAHTLQYQTYDVTALLSGSDDISFIVAGGCSDCCCCRRLGGRFLRIHSQKPHLCRQTGAARRAAPRIRRRQRRNGRHGRELAGHGRGQLSRSRLLRRRNVRRRRQA